MTNKNQKQIVLEGHNVSIGYHNKKQETVIHSHLIFELYQGELTCLLGANGAGKSTLLRTLSGIQPALYGNLELMNKSLAEYTERERSRTIGVVLTERTQTGGLTVWELVALGRQPHTGFFGRLTDTDKGLINQAIESVGITRLATAYMAELSDGERQKAFIAKALVQECPLILLDEPTAFLDVVSRIEIMTLLRKLAKEEHKAILLSTHDVDQALVLADRLWLLRANGGITCGVTEDIVLNNELETLFPESNICFDSQHGTYVPRPNYTQHILLETADTHLRHWTENALHRLGYACLGPNEPESLDVPRLTVISPHQIILETPSGQRVFTSYESLIKQLDKYNY